MIYIFWTTSSIDEAKNMVALLIKEKLIVCANIIPNVYSIYEWEGKLCEEQEVKVILKTDKSFYLRICHKIKELGSYDVPEISCVNIDEAYPPYLAWLKKGLF